MLDLIRFECQPGCTRCCEVQGYVYLTEENLQQAARFLGMTPQEFESQYVYRTRHLLRLRKPRGAQCHFLENGGCRIHPAKPTQCRAYPFWPDLVGSGRQWKKEAKTCPGINQGPLIQISQAYRTAHHMRESYPSLYRNR
jgi:uncharacterized protein